MLGSKRDSIGKIFRALGNDPLQFVGVGDSFAPSPFMLTLTAEKDKIQGLDLTPCTVPVTKKKK